MDRKPPETLYTYGNSECIYHYLVENTVKFAPPTSFNDPNEFVPNSESLRLSVIKDPVAVILKAQENNPTKISEEKKEIFEEYIKVNGVPEAYVYSLLTGINEIHQHVFRKFGVFCLSEANDNPLMWSHYGEHGKGICIGIKSTAEVLTSAIYEEIELRGLYPITYSAERSNNTERSLPERILKTATTKGIEWQYELEWRAFRKLKAERPEYINFATSDVTEIIFGPKVDRGTLRRAARQIESVFSHCKVYIAIPDPAYFKMMLEPLPMDELYFDLLERGPNQLSKTSKLAKAFGYNDLPE